MTVSSNSSKASFREFRLLLFVGVASFLLGRWEISRSLPTDINTVQAEWLLDSQDNLVETLDALYPNRSKANVYRALQATACFNIQYAATVCGQFPRRDLQGLRAQWERALSIGDKDNETAYYNYACNLLQLNASDEEIEAAITAWRVNFPHSKRVHPRQLIESFESQWIESK